MTEHDALRAARDELARTSLRLWRLTRPQLPSLTRTTSLWPQSSQMAVSACCAQKSISGWKQHGFGPERTNGMSKNMTSLRWDKADEAGPPAQADAIPARRGVAASGDGGDAVRRCPAAQYQPVYDLAAGGAVGRASSIVFEYYAGTEPIQRASFVARSASPPRSNERIRARRHRRQSHLRWQPSPPDARKTGGQGVTAHHVRYFSNAKTTRDAIVHHGEASRVAPDQLATLPVGGRVQRRA
jgi:hypothetical protein